MVLKKPSGKLATLTGSQNRLRNLVHEGKDELIKIELVRFKKLLTDIEIECQKINPEGETDIDDLTTWCSDNLDPKVDFLRNIEAHLAATSDVQPQDSISNVSGHSNRSKVSTASSARVEAKLKRMKLEVELDFLRKAQEIEAQEKKLQEAVKALARRRDEMAVEEQIAKERMKEKEFEELEMLQNNVTPIRLHEEKETRHLGKSSPQVRIEDVLDKVLNVQLQSSLPKRDLKIFDGNLMEFRIFMQAFNTQIEKKTYDEEERLAFLLQFTSGEAHDLISSCIHMDPVEGYSEAKWLLKREYGNTFRITSAYRNQLDEWPSMKEDPGKMKQFAALLQKCKTALFDLGSQGTLGDPDSLVRLMNKLPPSCRSIWRRKVLAIENNEQREANFSDFVNYVRQVSEEWNHPIFGIKAKGPENFRTDLGVQESSKRNVVLVTSSQETQRLRNDVCLFCNTTHEMSECQKAQSMSMDERWEILQGRCFGCLREGHWSRTCRQRRKCRTCGRSHPTILHRETPQINKREDPHAHVRGKNSEDTQVSGLLPGPTHVNVRSVQAQDKKTDSFHNSNIAVALVPVRLRHAEGEREITTYAAQDPYSTDTFIREDLVKALGLSGPQVQISLTTMEKHDSKWATNVIHGLEVCDMDSSEVIHLPPSYTHKDLPINREDIPKQEHIQSWQHLKSVPIHYSDADVGILIGMNSPAALRPLEVVAGKDEEPYAVRTKLGWSVHGPIGGKNRGSKVNRIKVQTQEVEELIKKMFNHEFPDAVGGSTFGQSKEDQAWLTKVEDSVCFKDGSYQIALPFREPTPEMPNNKNQALKRMFQLRKRFASDQRFQDDYVKFMQAMFNNNYAEEVREDDKQDSFYIPHHGVYHPRKPDQIRVVFDCSAKFKGVSLNSKLFSGPDLTNTLFGVLARFRQEQIALVADIESMFYRVRVPPEDRHYLRFLWWRDGDTSLPLIECQLTVHLFGATSSPSCANYALRKTASDNEQRFSKNAIDTLKNNFYVDDMLKSVATSTDAIKLQQEVTTLCKRGGFKLKKFVSNCPEVLNSLDEEAKSKIMINVDIRKDEVINRALGVVWDVANDQFGFSVPTTSNIYTRRNLLSKINALYDPLGMIAPVLLPARLSFREMCLDRSSTWDSELTGAFANSVSRWTEELEELSKLRLDRCYKAGARGNIQSYQLHHFSDASEKGVSSVTYLRMTDEFDQSVVAFVCGKARVAPLKSVSIPRLELAAAVLSVKQDSIIKQELQFTLLESVFWTDSLTVLKYIANEDKRFHTFVSNRLAMIHEASKKYQWMYVPTLLNPADDGSRGISVASLIQTSTWLTGPSFLRLPSRLWPMQLPISELPEDDENLRIVKIRSSNVSKEQFMESVASRCSSLSKLKRIVAVIVKAINKMRTNTLCSKSESIEYLIFKCVQKESFTKDFADIERHGKVTQSSCLSKLSPTLHRGLIRAGGRLRNATVIDEFKFPVILPKCSRVSQLIIRSVHQSCGHLGREYVLSHLRQKLWIIGANALVRREIGLCAICRRVKARSLDQLMSDLPDDRVTQSLPFERSGVDYFGPFLVKRGRSNEKRYGVIFTCLSTRAVHFEVAWSLNVHSFISALRRLMARRGSVKLLRSDNGTNFHGANTILRQEIEGLEKGGVEKAVEKFGIVWKFNPPCASHHGGVWERNIRTARQILECMLRELPHALSDESLITLFCEIEHIMNGRPLTTPSEDPMDIEALTPNHLLQLRGSIFHPFQDYSKDSFVRNTWKRIQGLADQFWYRWKREYLSELRSRQKWNKRQRNLKVGDFVLMMDNNLPRNQWLLGRVSECFFASDGLVRAVKVNTKQGMYERPITKLCLLLSMDEDHCE